MAVATSCATVLGLALAALFLRNRREKLDGSGAAEKRCVKRESMPDKENTILHEIMILDKGKPANGYVDIDPKQSHTTDTPATLVNHPKMFDDTVAMCSTGFCGPSPKTDSELLLYDTDPNKHHGGANPNNSLTECNNDATTPRNRNNNSSSRPSHNAPLVRMSPRHRSSPRTPGSGLGRLPPKSPSLGARPMETNDEEDYFTAGSSSSSSSNKNNNTGS